MTELRKFPRLAYDGTADIPITVIPFGRLERMDITVQGVDISEGGLGIRSDTQFAPGFVWFWNAIGPHNGGMIVWSRREVTGYRGGIQFLPIPQSPSEYLQTADG